MVDKEKSLIVKKNIIFKRVINFFRSLFKKKKENDVEYEGLFVNSKEHTDKDKINYRDNNNDIDFLNNESLLKKEYDANKNVFLDYDISNILDNPKFNSMFTEYNFLHDLDYNAEKKRLFDLYNNIKSGIIKIDKIDDVDLIIISQMLKEELNLSYSSQN